MARVTVTIQRGVSGTANDISIDSGNPTTSLNQGTSTYTGTRTSPAGTFRWLQWYDLSAIPTDATVVSATLTCQVSAGTNETIQVHRATGTWVPPGWTSASAWGDGTTTGLARFMDAETLYTFASGTSGNVSTRIDSLVQGWITTPATNYGLVLAQVEGAGATARTTWRSMYTGTAANRPSLVVVYDEAEEGGTSYDVTETDSQSAAESSTVGVSAPAVATESASAAESSTVGLSAGAGASEATAVGETSSAGMTAGATATEAATVGEAASVVVVTSAGASEGATVSEEAAGDIPGSGVDQYESVAIAESAGATVVAGGSASEAQAVAESASIGQHVGAGAAESVGAEESADGQPQMVAGASESASVGESSTEGATLGAGAAESIGVANVASVTGGTSSAPLGHVLVNGQPRRTVAVKVNVGGTLRRVVRIRERTANGWNELE